MCDLTSLVSYTTTRDVLKSQILNARGFGAHPAQPATKAQPPPSSLGLPLFRSDALLTLGSIAPHPFPRQMPSRSVRHASGPWGTSVNPMGKNTCSERSNRLALGQTQSTVNEINARSPQGSIRQTPTGEQSTETTQGCTPQMSKSKQIKLCCRLEGTREMGQVNVMWDPGWGLAKEREAISGSPGDMCSSVSGESQETGFSFPGTSSPMPWPPGVWTGL